ncbi:toxin glutamine deamidase domain-containing protein [Planotetraspora thailandica]|uniref:toxin glutamine deamidase domain-containing protein n=1 Tax=Planotetraspora thailandica TaxID=487172 RepID=UPI001EF34B99|nr:toxin glutamine deamidase domain-containing protein [Planotetraspora thailandica]
MSADGRRWRDYEKAAEAPAPAAEDRGQDDRRADECHAGVRVSALANGTADGLTNGVLSGASVRVQAALNGAAGVKDTSADTHADTHTAAHADARVDPVDDAGTETAAHEPEHADPPAAPMEPVAEDVCPQEEEREPDWFDSDRRPMRLEDTRPYGKAGGLAEPRPGTEEATARESLAQAVSGRFPDPRGTWIRLINAEGPTEDPFRSTNAVDCALAVVSTWHGEPVVAARRLPEFDAGGKPLLTGETGGVARAEQWLGHRFEYVGHGRRAYVAIAQRLVFGGHGAAAMLITRWPGGGSHAWNAVNCRDEVLWIDAQRGHMAVEPPYEVVTGVFCVVIDREGHRL